MVYLALLPLMRAPRLPVVDWTYASSAENGALPPLPLYTFMARIGTWFFGTFYGCSMLWFLIHRMPFSEHHGSYWHPPFSNFCAHKAHLLWSVFLVWCFKHCAIYDMALVVTLWEECLQRDRLSQIKYPSLVKLWTQDAGQHLRLLPTEVLPVIQVSYRTWHCPWEIFAKRYGVISLKT
jgi:hypothetical protein